MLPESEGIPSLIVELTKTSDASGVALNSITRGATAARHAVRPAERVAAGDGPLLRRRGLPVPPRELRGLPQRQLPRHRQAAGGQDPDHDRRCRHNVGHRAAADRHRRAERVSVGEPGTAATAKEVPRDRQQTHAHLRRHRAHRRRRPRPGRGSGAQRRAGRRLGAGGCSDAGTGRRARRHHRGGHARQRRPGQAGAAARQVRGQGPVHPAARDDDEPHSDPKPDVEPERDSFRRAVRSTARPTRS